MRLFVFIFLLLFGFHNYAQDTLMLGYNANIPAKVLKVGSTQVKYKDWDDPGGPVFRLKLQYVVSIHFQDGRIYTGDSAYDAAYNKKMALNPPVKQHPVETINPADSLPYAVKDSLYKHSIYALPDTLFLSRDTVWPVRILHAGTHGIYYAPWDSVMGPEYLVSAQRLVKIKYQDGKTDYPADLKRPAYWPLKWDMVRARERAKPGYLSDLHRRGTLVKKARQWHTAGAALTGTGIVITLAGAVLRGIAWATWPPPSSSSPADLVQHDLSVHNRCFIGGNICLSLGVPAAVMGIASLITGSVYSKKAYWVHRKMVAVNLPQPAFILPTAQNNFEKGFALSTAVMF